MKKYNHPSHQTNQNPLYNNRETTTKKKTFNLNINKTYY